MEALFDFAQLGFLKEIVVCFSGHEKAIVSIQEWNYECIISCCQCILQPNSKLLLKQIFSTMHQLWIGLLWVFLGSSTGFQIDPINEECLTSASYAKEQISSIQTTLHRFELKPFSQTFIELDLRHLQSLTQDNGDTVFSLKGKINSNTDIFDSGQEYNFDGVEADVNIYSFYVTELTYFWPYFEIEDGYQAYKYLLMDSISILTEVEDQRNPNKQESFLFIMKSLQNINLPYNRPKIDPYLSYYLQKISSTNSYSRLLEAIETNNYWTTYQSLALPYIPYFSNCLSEGDEMFLGQLMQDPSDCKLIPTAETKPINQFMFGSSPYSDSCIIKRECIYDQSPLVRSEFPYWQTLPAGTSAFYITQNKIPANSYEIGQIFQDTQIVKCKINGSKGTNSSNQFPLKVNLILDYYQDTQSTKKMIACTIDYSLYVESSPNFAYKLQIETRPLNHTNILLAFGFNWYVYMIVFVLIGVISNIQNLVLWLFHNCVSRVKKKVFRVKIYLTVIGQILKGTIMGLIFFIVLLFSVTIVMNGKIFDTYLYEETLSQNIPRVFWDTLNTKFIFGYSSARAEQYRVGRMGISFLIVGSVIIFHTSRYFIGCEKAKKDYRDYSVIGRKIKPSQWNRGKFIFGTFFFIFIQFIFIYFAYSKLYSENIWTFIVVMKVIQMIMEEITKEVYEDLLPFLPLKIITDITAYMNTLSANNFYDFLFSFLIDVAINMIEKAYFSQLQNIIVDKVKQKIQEIERFYAYLINDAEGEQKEAVSEEIEKDDEQNTLVVINGVLEEVKFFDHQEIQFHNEDSDISLDEKTIISTQKLLKDRLSYSYKQIKEKNNLMDSQKIVNSRTKKHQNEPENISTTSSMRQRQSEEQSYIFQMLLDNIILLFTFFVQPFVVLVYWITYDESKILNSYGISSSVIILYLLSAITIAAFTIINVILICHLLECYIEINFEKITTQLLERFRNRKIFWKAHDEDINKVIGASLRGADHYCLSWQFFLLLAVYVSSMILVMLGISILMNSEYNPFKDVVIILIFIFWYCFVRFLIWLIQSLARKLNVDSWADLDTSHNNQNAIKDVVSVNEKLDEGHQSANSEQNSHHALVLNESDNDFGIILGQKTRAKIDRKSLVKVIPKLSKKVLSMQSSYREKKSSLMGESCFNSQMSDENLNIKIDNICKKLQPGFENDQFSVHFFRKNKKYLKENLQKVLPLIQEMPELIEYRVLDKPVQELSSTKQNKNYDPLVLEIINKWKNRTELEAQRRQSRGKELEENLSICNFCFETWAIYHGFGGICLKCSQIFQETRKDK